MARLKSTAPDVAAAVLVAIAVLIVVGHVFPYFDYFYALIWGQDLIRGRAPDYAAPFAPAAHPLVNAVAAAAGALGRAGAVEVMRLSGPLALGALCVGLFRLGQALFGWPVGLLAAALTATREPMLVAAARGYLDVPSTALIVWAAVLEARRPRRGIPVLVLLVFAGLMRPEAWLLAAAYFLWVAPSRGWPDRLRLAAVTAAGPVLWLLSDLLVTGDPFLRFHILQVTVPETPLNYPSPTTRTGLLAVPDALATDFGNYLRPVPLALAVGGVVVGLVWARRRVLLPVAVAALNVTAFVILAVNGAVIEQRYLFPALAMSALLAAVLAVGWLSVPPAARRRVWSVAGICALAALLAFLVPDVRRLDDARSTLVARNEAESDLHRLIQRPAAARVIERSRLVNLPTPSPLPFLAFWTGKPPTGFSIDLANPATPSAFLAPRTAAATMWSGPSPSGPTPPPGYTRAVVNRSWILYEKLAPP